MWHILKLTYQLPDTPGTVMKMHGYEPLEDATRVFDQLQAGYQLNNSVRVKGGKLIKVTGVWLYESFKNRYDDAIEAVQSGNATLMREAREIEFDIA